LADVSVPQQGTHFQRVRVRFALRTDIVGATPFVLASATWSSMILFLRPRIIFLFALALAIPTWGVSLLVFYFAFKRPYDSRGASAILAEAKRSMETRRAQQLSHLNRGAISRVFSKFTDPLFVDKHESTVPFVHWGVLRHPMLNGGQLFTLRVNRKGDEIHVEASPGEAWWLLTDQVWLGRRGTAPGLPASLVIKPNDLVEPAASSDPQDTAIGLLIMELSVLNMSVQLTPLTYGEINAFAERHELSAEWYQDYGSMKIWLTINNLDYRVDVTNLEPSKKLEGPIEMSAGRSA
jgi:hypothetical protein